jgi:cytochrome oxidase Cu insertion factor (SCO1/SenC/PrrC family)
MGGVQSSSKLDEVLEKTNVERSGLVFKTVPEEQVQNIVSKLEGKTAYQLAELLQPVNVDGKKCTGKDVLNALNKHNNYITHISFVLTVDDNGKVHMYLRFEGNRYALEKEAKTGDEQAKLLLNLPQTNVKREEKLAEAVIKNTGLFAFSKVEKNLDIPVEWKI